MTAAEARRLVNQQEAVDNSGTILRDIKRAARDRKTSIVVDADLMTQVTLDELKRRGFEVHMYPAGASKRGCSVSW